MFRAHVETLTPPSQIAEIKAAALDSPRNNGLNKSAEVILAGWILRGEEEGGPLELIVESETGETRVPLDVERPDVISRVLDKASDKRLRCGFKLTIRDFSNASLYIATKGRRDLWAKIYFVEEPLEAIEEKLNYFMNVLVQGPLQDDQLQVSLHKYALTDAQERREIILSKLKTVDPKGFITNIEPSKKSLPESFFEELRKIDAFSRFFETATKDGKIVFRDVFTKDNATCSFSYISDNNVNLLFFEGPSEPFIILQHVTYADVIFFPKRMQSVVIQPHLSDNSIASCLSDAIHWICNTKPKRTKARRCFGGGISGFGRPYHFFYDILPGIAALDESGTLARIQKIYTKRGAFFLRPEELFSSTPETTIYEPENLRSRSVELGEFYCFIGFPFPYLSPDRNERFEKLILNAALSKRNEYTESKTSETLRLWWGVTGQKRSWIEQVGGTAYILEQLSEEYPELEVIFDGWTCPPDPGPNDAQEIRNDEGVVAAILSLLKKPILTRSIIGKTSLEKIAIATTCDAFVANYSTGSMHVSRFARRPGVVHINNKIPKGVHIQHRAVVVPASRTRDLPEDDDKRADFVSYSIDPDDILFLLRSVIEARNSN